VSLALERIAEIDVTIAEIRREAHLDEWEAERAELKAKVDDLVINKLEAFEDDKIKITRVQGFKRTWDADRLEKILPRAIFRRVIKITPDPAKIDAEVKAGNIEVDRIAPALNETPNKAYAKWTAKSESDGGAAEAESLAAKL
jgi:hypothetical protein